MRGEVQQAKNMSIPTQCLSFYSTDQQENLKTENTPAPKTKTIGLPKKQKTEMFNNGY